MSASAQNRDSRKVKRVRLERPMRVVIASIGAQVRYETTARDISHTGFFLEFDSPNRFPFNQSSILEVWAELEPDCAIFFNGKMARVVGKENAVVKDSGAGIAIKIVQIDRDNEKILQDFITRKSNDNPGSAA
ncbi:PilZ domain-containing protein [Oligoflexus tunisiensis]|uniref:PilZ domain-containing protein n=1 Tax=Oligoflexus tunisiensis TaxID=708132 RepID=UPI00159F2669|nr:PilZ domain-containing protein [Oligoflexus tunisiensis]